MSALEARNLVKEYRGDNYVVRVLDDLSFDADPGELVVLLGPSGSGKTTLLSCLGGMIAPTSGTIRVGDVELTDLVGAERDAYRRKRVGFAFQGFNLIPSLSARENVAVPLLVDRSVSRAEAYDRADGLLAKVGMAERAGHKPSQLSGGQQQRVAVARGLVTDPFLLIADEPTASLDHVQAESVIRILRELRDDGRIIVVSTHDGRLVPAADRVVHMAPGGAAVEAERTTVRYAPGETIFHQGEHADLVYVIVEGEVEIYRAVGDGTEDRLALIPAGNYFGELGALMGFPRSASARARTEVVAEAMSAGEFRRGVEGGRY